MQSETTWKGRYPMKKFSRNLIATLVLGILVAGLSGCKKEGPMERTGKEIDKATEKTGDKIEKAGEKIKDSVK
jgi:predicted small lipoprotein YifL